MDKNAFCSFLFIQMIAQGSTGVYVAKATTICQRCTFHLFGFFLVTTDGKRLTCSSLFKDMKQ